MSVRTYVLHTYMRLKQIVQDGTLGDQIGLCMPLNTERKAEYTAPTHHRKWLSYLGLSPFLGCTLGSLFWCSRDKGEGRGRQGEEEGRGGRVGVDIELRRGEKREGEGGKWGRGEADAHEKR